MGSDLRKLDAEVAGCLGLHQRMIRPQPLTQFSGDKTYTPRYGEPHSLYGVPDDIQDGVVPYVELVQYELKPYSSCPIACEAVKHSILKHGWMWDIDMRTSHSGYTYECTITQGIRKHVRAKCLTEYEAVCRAFVAAVKGGQYVESR